MTEKTIEDILKGVEDSHKYNLKAIKLSSGLWEIRNQSIDCMFDCISEGKTEKEAWKNAQSYINEKLSEYNVLKHEIDEMLQYCS